jgi:hypothetical protein
MVAVLRPLWAMQLCNCVKPFWPEAGFGFGESVKCSARILKPTELEHEWSMDTLWLVQGETETSSMHKKSINSWVLNRSNQPHYCNLYTLAFLSTT